MDKERGYSVLILPWSETRVRRLVLSPRVLRCARWVALFCFCTGLVFLGDYFWMKIEREEVLQMQAAAHEQRKRLENVYEQTEEVADLLARWKTVKQKVQASLPSRRQPPAREQEPLKVIENHVAELHTELQRLIAATPTEWPVQGYVSSGLGSRISPWTGEQEFHSGIDIPKPLGSPVYAPADGVVGFVGQSEASGRALILGHGEGIVTHYAHLSKTHVKEGQFVKKGERIGDVGNTGRSTGPHLHYEVRVNGFPIDPRRHLLKQTIASSPTGESGVGGSK